ncbi:hypothetical protein [Nonomuraea sp. NPDC003804]|uniref:hypothetical protein n=1 Tax=Nonomuraea sp. NPDC003804 TaxID=3154547 RepID=UPI00339F6728
MGLTWKDAGATALAGANVAVYAAFLSGAQMPVVRTVGGTAATIVLLGLLGGCALGRGDLGARPRSPAILLYTVVARVLGVVALLSTAMVLVTASELALATLFIATMALWLGARVRNATTRACS